MATEGVLLEYYHSVIWIPSKLICEKLLSDMSSEILFNDQLTKTNQPVQDLLPSHWVVCFLESEYGCGTKLAQHFDLQLGDWLPAS